MDFKRALVCAAGAMLTSFGAGAAEGDLLPAFGQHGIAWVGTPRPYYGFATRPAVQPDGKIVVCDAAPNPVDSGDAFVVARFDAAGSLDEGFGTSGHVVIADGSTDCIDIAVQDDGRIVVVGDYYADPSALPAGFLVIRLDPDGEPDASFGNGDGRATVYFSGSGSEFSAAVGVRVRGDGRIVLAGPTSTTSQDEQFAVAQLLPDGQLDTTFGNGGKATISFDDIVGSAVKDHPTALALDRQGRIVVGGFSYSGAPNGPARFAVARLTPGGSPDASFGDAGRAIVAFSAIPEERDMARSLAVQRDGRIVIAGSANLPIPALADPDMAVARLLDDGTLDPSFGGGRVRIAFGANEASSDAANAVALQDDGKVVLAGQSGNHPAIARLASDGSLDTSFGDGGRKVYDLPDTAGFGYFNGVRFQQGRLLVSGDTATTGQDIYDGFVADLGVDLIFSDGLE